MRLLLVFIMSVLPLAAEIPKQHLEDFYKLSVVCQNARFEMRPPGVRVDHVDPSIVEPYVKKINALLDGLVEKGALEKATLKLSNPAEMDQKKARKMTEIFEASVAGLSDEYGLYVVAEMMDYGIWREVSVIEKGEDFRVTLRMPKKELDTLRKALKEAGFLE